MRHLTTLLSWLCLPFALCYWFGVLVRLRASIRRAKVILLPSVTKNFGYTVMIPDTARRIWPGQALYLMSWEPGGTQNRHVARLWSDIEVQAVRRPCLFFRVFGRPIRLPDHGLVEPLAFRMTRLVAKLLGPGISVLDHEDLYAHAIEAARNTDEGADMTLTGEKSYDALIGNAAWGILTQRKPSSLLKFRSEEREQFRRNIAQITGTDARRLCAVHLRHDHVHAGHARNGSGAAAWPDAIRALVDANYTVLLSGDEGIDDPSPFVLDEHKLNMDREIFRLMAATEADIFIGDSGAGGLITAINKVPMLVFNAYPLLSALPGSWNYPKLLRSSIAGAGRQGTADDRSFSVSEMRELLHRRPFAPFIGNDHEIESLAVPASDIRSAVIWFLDNLTTLNDPAPAIGSKEQALMSALPAWALARACNARLVPAFLDRLEVEDGPVNGGVHTSAGPVSDRGATCQ